MRGLLERGESRKRLQTAHNSIKQIRGNPIFSREERCKRFADGYSIICEAILSELEAHPRTNPYETYLSFLVSYKMAMAAFQEYLFDNKTFEWNTAHPDYECCQRTQELYASVYAEYRSEELEQADLEANKTITLEGALATFDVY